VQLVHFVIHKTVPSLYLKNVQYCHRCKQQPRMSTIHSPFFKQHWGNQHLLVNVKDDFYVNIMTIT